MATIIRLCLLAAVLFAPVLAQAQQSKTTPRIGILRVGKPPDPFIDAFRQGLQTMGYIEGQTILVDYRWLQREDQLNEASEELVRLPVDIIVATTTAICDRPNDETNRLQNFGLDLYGTRTATSRHATGKGMTRR